MKELETLNDRMTPLVTEMVDGQLNLDECVKTFKKLFLVAALNKFNGNQCKAARAIGKHRNTFSRTCDELDINPAKIRFAKKQPRSTVPDLDTRYVCSCGKRSNLQGTCLDCLEKKLDARYGFERGGVA
jgi:Fis family transcriptional regulator